MGFISTGEHRWNETATDNRSRLTVNAAYVTYSEHDSAQTVDLTETGGVACDVDAAGNIVGIEILSIRLPGQIETARRFAVSRGLTFPRDLTGALVSP